MTFTLSTSSSQEFHYKLQQLIFLQNLSLLKNESQYESVYALYLFLTAQVNASKAYVSLLNIFYQFPLNYFFIFLYQSHNQINSSKYLRLAMLDVLVRYTLRWSKSYNTWH